MPNLDAGAVICSIPNVGTQGIKLSYRFQLLFRCKDVPEPDIKPGLQGGRPEKEDNYRFIRLREIDLYWWYLYVIWNI